MVERCFLVMYVFVEGLFFLSLLKECIIYFF